MSRDKISRESAIEELQRLIREQRSRIDPEILQKAARAADQKNSPPPQKKQEITPQPAVSPREVSSPDVSPPDVSLPYDRDSAAKSVELFLRNHKDKDGMRRKLMELLAKNKG